MIQKRAFRPQVEDCLETRVALSAFGATQAVVASAPALTASVQAHGRSLVGLISGSYLGPVTSGPSRQIVRGEGSLSGLGNVRVSGVLFFERTFDAPSHGFLVIKNAHGSITLKLTTAGDSNQSTIVSATGAYKGAHGKGTAIAERGGAGLFLVGHPNLAESPFNMALNEPFPPNLIQP
jgi:hypothetical protein